MGISDLARILDPIKRKIFLLIGKALLTAINNEGKVGTYDSGSRANPQRLTMNWFGQLTDIERSQPFGFETYPVVGTSKAVLLNPDGARSNVFCIMVQDDAYRPTDLSEGEVCIYDKDDNRIWIKNGKLHIVHSGDVEMEIGGDLKVKGDIIANWDTTPISVVNHPHIGDLGFNTGAPVVVGGGVAPPGSAPTYDSGTNTADLKGMDLDNVGTISTTLANHTHNQPNDTGGDVESPTNAPN